MRPREWMVQIGTLSLVKTLRTFSSFRVQCATMKGVTDINVQWHLSDRGLRHLCKAAHKYEQLVTGCADRATDAVEDSLVSP